MESLNINDLRPRLFKLIRQDAFFCQKITLSSGKESDFYIDARLVTLSGEGAFLCASIIWEMVKDENPDAVGGPTLGADPIAGALAAISYLNKKPLNTFIIRKAPKPHGRMRHIEGHELKAGAKVVLIDDVATTGKSLVEAVEKLRAYGINILKAIVIVDRQEGARESLTKVNCPLVSVFTAADFLK
ncbi:MAG: orotate phosphoribosyltransferase [Candidatus Omnitrophota bacterium]